MDKITSTSRCAWGDDGDSGGGDDDGGNDDNDDKDVSDVWKCIDRCC